MTSIINAAIKFVKDVKFAVLHPPKITPEYKTGHIELEEMFDKSHYNGTTVWDLLKLIAYFPFGVGLFVVRLNLLFLLLGLLAFSNTFHVTHLIFGPTVWRWTLRMFGIFCRFNDRAVLSRVKKPFIFTSNHRAAFDILPFLPFGPFNVVIDRDFFNSSIFSRSFLHAARDLVGTIRIAHHASEREQQRQDIQKQVAMEHRPLLVFPEGWDNNGRGLMVFQKYTLSLGVKVVPTALSVRIPWLPLNPGKLGTSILAELFWLFFPPIVRYELEFLPVMHRDADEDPAHFARRVQVATARALNVPVTDFHKRDALAYRQSIKDGKTKTY